MYAYYFLPDQNLQQLYTLLLHGIMTHQSMIPCELPPHHINLVIKAILTDHPELFWFEGRWCQQMIEERKNIVPEYVLSISEVNKAQKMIHDALTELQCLKGQASYVKAKSAYDWLLSYASYGMTETNGQNIYDVFIKKKAVCKGISKAYQYILNELGLFSTLAEGTLDGIAKHIWNIIEIDGCYYHVDICMGYKQFSYLFPEAEHNNRYRCFAISDTQIKRTHKFIDSEIPRLSCEKNYKEVSL